MTVGYRIKGKKGKLVPLDSKTPHRCVILAFDQAIRSGWCSTRLGFYVDSGEISESAGPDYEVGLEVIMRRAYAAGMVDAVPCVIVFEKPFSRSVEGIATQIRVKRRILAVWRRVAVGNGGKVVQVPVPTWRSRILGEIKGPNLRFLESETANIFSGQPTAVLGPDQNAAICIAKWATNAGEVAKVIPQRFWGSSE